VNAGVEHDPLMRLVADLPHAESDAARARRVRARCQKAIANRNDRTSRARARTARIGGFAAALYRIWYSLAGSLPSRCFTKL
jgi:hypothetical protein